MSGKRKAPSKRVPGGYPQIAHPTDTPVYEWQRNFVYGWFFEMLGRLKGNDVEAARSAMEALESPFLRFTSTLLGIARAGKDKTSKQWAGRLLASIGCSIQKHDPKLSNANKAYRLEKKNIGKLRIDVLFPKGIGIVVRRELKKTERLRGLLLMNPTTCDKHWREVVKGQRIPKSYWPTMKLPEFSVKSEPQWWKFLWPLIKKNNPDLLETLRKRSSRNSVTYDRPGKWSVKSVKTSWKDYRNEFRNHFRTLARLRNGGVL